MDHEPPTRRRRSRAIAIRATVDAQRKAFFARLTLALAAAAMVFETLSVMRYWMSAAHQ